jgi:glutaminase
LSSCSSSGEGGQHDNNSRQLNANMIKSGLYPVSGEILK